MKDWDINNRIVLNVLNYLDTKDDNYKKTIL